MGPEYSTQPRKMDSVASSAAIAGPAFSTSPGEGQKRADGYAADATGKRSAATQPCHSPGKVTAIGSIGGGQVGEPPGQEKRI